MTKQQKNDPETLEHRTSRGRREKDFSDLIQRSIHRAFIKFGLASGAVVIAILLIVFFVISPLCRQIYYNPARIISPRDSTASVNQASLDIGIYTQLNHPLATRDNVQVTTRRFADYDITIQQNIVKPWEDQHDVAGKIVRNRLTFYDANFLRMLSQNTFARNSNYSENQWAGGSLNYQKSLPDEWSDTQMVKAYISFNESLRFDEMRSFESGLAEWMDVWEMIDTGDKRVLGMPAEPSETLFTGCFDSSRYPYLATEFLNSKNTLDAMKTDESVAEAHFLSMLKYMNDHRTFLDIMKDSTDYRSAARYVVENGLNFSGAVIVGTKADILELWQNPYVWGMWYETY